MALTNTQVANAKPKEKIYKLFDGGGLHLLVKPTGYRGWKYDYRLNGGRETFTIGKYPEISLKEAREYHREARSHVEQGRKPLAIRKKKEVQQNQQEKSFSDYAKEWIAKQNLVDSTLTDLVQRLEKNIYPYLDEKPVTEFSTRDLYQICLLMSDRGSKETAIRMAGVMRRVFNELLIFGIIENNPAQGLAELLPKPDHKKKENFGHVTSADALKNLLLQIENPSNRQDPVVTQALKLMPLVFLRPKNIRFMRWSQIDFDEQMLTIPAEEMKAHKEHKVPLPHQAIQILEDLKPLTGDCEFVFVSGHSRDGKPLSENTTTQALRRFINPETGEPFGTGYMTSHGFRHTASTMLNEMGYSADAIELQLAHLSKDRIRATYNKAQLMPERRKMLQEWADYLDELKQA
ncbi:tyrosine-type recombinase/integrase [Magnetovirga frankeli]|uniref:tyrosine-type recombinase/integrase n=1 Tax=Magnetovirga frankeli TaxID=947516 RepID=UPI001293D5D3|nr:tyrosine-type recombinase/integrase [gamma proteobacterium SS-5]